MLYAPPPPESNVDEKSVGLVVYRSILFVPKWGSPISQHWIWGRGGRSETQWAKADFIQIVIESFDFIVHLQYYG